MNTFFLIILWDLQDLIIENLESEIKRLKDHLIRSQNEYDNAIMDMNEMSVVSLLFSCNNLKKLIKMIILGFKSMIQRSKILMRL